MSTKSTSELEHDANRGKQKERTEGSMTPSFLVSGQIVTASHVWPKPKSPPPELIPRAAARRWRIAAIVAAVRSQTFAEYENSSRL